MGDKLGSDWEIPVKLPVIPAKVGSWQRRHCYKIPKRRTAACALMTRNRGNYFTFAGMTGSWCNYSAFAGLTWNAHGGV